MKDKAAFPVCDPDKELGFVQRGMTLREYYAGQALAGILAGAWANEGVKVQTAAKGAVDYADALIAELEKEQKP